MPENKVNILSIDFDFFIDTDMETRNNKFPKGADEVPKHELEKMWEDSYNQFPEIYNIGVTQSFNQLTKYLEGVNTSPTTFVADSHKEIRQVIEQVDSHKTIQVVNIDFHHDMYHYFTNGDNYNCSNWARRLIEDKPLSKIVWVKRIDSDTRVLGGEVECEQSLDLQGCLENIKFDYIFLCKSPEWSPPHLSNYYEKLKTLIG